MRHRHRLRISRASEMVAVHPLHILGPNRYSYCQRLSITKPCSPLNLDYSRPLGVCKKPGFGRKPPSLPVLLELLFVGAVAASRISASDLPCQRYSKVNLNRYADRYACPQVFWFDNSNFLMLQFKATERVSIKDANCEVDCWVLPRQSINGSTLRYGLYRLLALGFRRCQSWWV
jgi:hypothetical protein